MAKKYDFQNVQVIENVVLRLGEVPEERSFKSGDPFKEEQEASLLIDAGYHCQIQQNLKQDSIT